MIESAPFGVTRSGHAVHRHTLSNAAGTRFSFLDFGGVITAIEAPDRDGRRANVVLACRTLAEYEARSPYFGALIGRYANRLARGTFILDGETYTVPLNNGPNALHGGPGGFNARLWAFAGHDDHATLSLESPDGENGFPGTLRVTVAYSLSEDDRVRIEYRAETDAPTVLNLTNHAYFNLAGEGKGSIAGHLLRADAAHYTPIDDDLIPTGEVASVAGTPLDFRETASIGARLRSGHGQMVRARGYDHNLVLRGGASDTLRFAALVQDPASGRVLDCHTTEPGLQFYTGNFLDGTITGPSGATYRQGDGFTLETQHFPDSPNHPHFPSTILRPGEVFSSATEFRFGVA